MDRRRKGEALGGVEMATATGMFLLDRDGTMQGLDMDGGLMDLGRLSSISGMREVLVYERDKTDIGYVINRRLRLLSLILLLRRSITGHGIANLP